MVVGKDGFQVVTIVGGGIALDGKYLGDAAAGVAALDVDQQMD